MDALDKLKQAAAHLPDLRPHRVIDSTNPETGHTRYAVQFVYGHETYEKWFATPFYDNLDQLVYDFVIVLEDTTMANIFQMSGDLFQYMTGEMIPDGKDFTMTIKKVVIEELENQRGKQSRAVLHFKETNKGFVAGNKTNVRQLVAMLGEETDDWIGKRITLYSTHVQAFGETHLVIRVRDRLPKQNGNGNGAPKVSTPAPEPTEPDELPFDIDEIRDAHSGPHDGGSFQQTSTSPDPDPRAETSPQEQAQRGRPGQNTNGNIDWRAKIEAMENVQVGSVCSMVANAHDHYAHQRHAENATDLEPGEWLNQADGLNLFDELMARGDEKLEVS